MPAKLNSGKHVCLGVDYTHIASRLRRMTVQDKIPGIRSEPWREVAGLKKPDGSPLVHLSIITVDAKGADQMSITQSLAFWSDEVFWSICF